MVCRTRITTITPYQADNMNRGTRNKITKIIVPETDLFFRYMAISGNTLAPMEASLLIVGIRHEVGPLGRIFFTDTLN